MCVSRSIRANRTEPSNWERDTTDARRRHTMLWCVAARRRQRRRKRQQPTGDDSDMRSARARSTQRVVSKWGTVVLIFIHRKFVACAPKRGSDEGPPVSQDANRRDRLRASRADPHRCIRRQTIQSSVRGDRLVAACVLLRGRHRRHGRHAAVAAMRACRRKSSQHATATAPTRTMRLRSRRYCIAPDPNGRRHGTIDRRSAPAATWDVVSQAPPCPFRRVAPLM
jgi:hypothetical protein